MRTRLMTATLFLFATYPVLAQTTENFSIHIRPGADLPIGSKSSLFVEDAPYLFGGTIALTGQYIFPRLPFLFTEGGLNLGIHPTQAQNTLTLTSAGFGIGYDARLADRMSLQVTAHGGLSFGVYGTADPATNPYAGGNIGATWDLSPDFALSAGGTYRFHLGWDATGGAYTDLYQGTSIWAGAIIRLNPDSGRHKLRITEARTQPLFPVFYSYYENNPFGSITIQNLENSAITNVDVYFYIGEYMEQPMLTTSLPSLARNGSAEVPLKALFTSRLINLTESAKVSSEIRISYTYLGERFTYTQPLTVTILDRNSMTWDDDRKAASFVTPRDPTVLIFSKNTAGLIRDLGHNPLNLNFRIAMGIFEAMRLYGLNYVIDPQSSFIEASQDELFLDYLQFPSQSLIYRAGDCDDLSILLASLLESVGIKTAFITIPGHIFMAFSLGMSEGEARKTFTGAGDFIYKDNDTWVPVEVTLVQEGFLKAYRTAVNQWREANSKNVAGFFPIHEAWETFRPVGFTGNTLSLLFPSAEAVIQSYKTNLDAFVSQEIQSQVEKFQSRIKIEGDRASLRNSFGILYAKYGLFEQAENQFKTALKLDKKATNPMINLANLYFLLERNDDALEWYKNAAAIVPDNPLVIAGLARASYEKEDYQQAQLWYTRLKNLNPDIASQYAYIGGTSISVMRASASMDKGRTFWDGEE